MRCVRGGTQCLVGGQRARVWCLAAGVSKQEEEKDIL